MNNKVAGIKIRMGRATLAIIVLPMWMNSAEEKVSSERVSVNQVPQKTPVTSAINTIEKNSSHFNFMRQRNPEKTWLKREGRSVEFYFRLSAEKSGRLVKGF